VRRGAAAGLRWARAIGGGLGPGRQRVRGIRPGAQRHRPGALCSAGDSRASASYSRRVTLRRCCTSSCQISASTALLCSSACRTSKRVCTSSGAASAAFGAASRRSQRPVARVREALGRRFHAQRRARGAPLHELRATLRRGRALEGHVRCPAAGIREILRHRVGCFEAIGDWRLARGLGICSTATTLVFPLPRWLVHRSPFYGQSSGGRPVRVGPVSGAWPQQEGVDIVNERASPGLFKTNAHISRSASLPCVGSTVP